MALANKDGQVGVNGKLGKEEEEEESDMGSGEVEGLKQLQMYNVYHLLFAFIFSSADLGFIMGIHRLFLNHSL